MTNEEAAKERDRIRQESIERANKERNQSSEDRAKENNERNSERRQQRDSASNALITGKADVKLSEIVKLGGAVGRKLEREIRQFQQTGRVSNWLAGETIKAEAAQNASQQAAFKEQVLDVISSSSTPIQIGSKSSLNSFTTTVNTKPIVYPEGGDGVASVAQPWDLIVSGNLVTVRAGTLNNFLPTNMDIERTISGTALYYAKAVIATDGTNITSVSIAIDTTPPIDQEPEKFGIPNSVEYLFGLFQSGVATRVIGNGNINLSPKQWLVVSADPPAGVGESPFDIYYRLQ